MASTSRGTPSLTSKDDPLQPLRAMADRVGKEVEKFAERVDHWHTHGNEDDNSKYQTTLRMVGKFRDLADSTVKELKKQNEAENKGELNMSVQRRIQKMAELPSLSNEHGLGASFQSVVPSIELSSTPDSSSVQELRQWQAELATWELLQIIIKHYHPEPGTDVAAEKRSQLKNVGGAMRYSPNSEIWNRFLLEDDQAKEKEIILRWLEQTAHNSESDIESITEQLEAQSGKPTNTWTNGWLDTKSKIKQAKRLQGIEGPLGSHVTSLKNSDGTQILSTQLDPDAPARQKRSLERSDEFYERALWMVCYEMLRRGKPWEEISDWCKERNEAWRGVSIGTAYESHPDGGPNVAGPTVGYLFRRMCFYAARGARIPYEGAVYGLLSGDLKQVETVCRTWDDHLYARYNSLLLSRFDGYLQKQHSHRISLNMTRKFIFEDAVANIGDWETSSSRVIGHLKQQKATAAQSLSPMKLIQGSLISRDVDELVYKVGVAIAILFQGDERPLKLVTDPKPDPLQRNTTVEKHYQTLATDPYALRILVHVFIALRRGLHLFRWDTSYQWTNIDNVITAYIEFLRITKRIQLIPLYAAQLEGGPGHCLARILPDIKNTKEQEDYIKIMELYRINPAYVISENCSLAMENSGLSAQGTKPISRFAILEPTSDPDYLWPGQRIKREFPGLDVEPKEDALIESLRWHNHLEKEMTKTFVDLTKALKVFLLNGRIGAAEKLITEMSVESLSQRMTQAFCGYSFDFTQPGTEEQDEILVTQAARKSFAGRASLRLSDIPSAQEHAKHVRSMRRESSTYYELQQLVRLIALFREWREEEDNLISLRSQGTKVNTKRIKDLFDAIQTNFGTLIESFSEPVASLEIWELKKAYVPEIIVAYISVAQTSSFFIHRDSAVKAMDIATIVADDDRQLLQRLFMETGRMTQLVDTLALVSRAMLKLGELGEAKRIPAKKRGSRGETLKIWDLTTRN